MRIAILHSRYLSGDVSGENRVVADEATLLRDAGHEVLEWTPSPEDLAGIRLVKTGLRAVWSPQAVRAVERMVQDFQPQIVHVHNLFPMLSPAVIRSASRGQVAVVMTLHNYRLLCLPALFLRNERNCEDCLGHLPWRGVIHRCYKGSLLGSAALATSLGIHRAMSSFSGIDLYLATSEFTKNKHLEAGLPAERIRVKPNFAWPQPRRRGAGSYFLYVGRLSAEKGLSTLLRAWADDPPGRLVVIGDGPERQSLESVAPDSVEFRGALPAEDIPKMFTDARALLIPSLWGEPGPRIVVEAYASGVPVVASRIGALAELVHDRSSGLLVEPGEVRAWHEAATAMTDDSQVMRLGGGALQLWQKTYSPERARESLERFYSEAMDRKDKRGS